MNAGGKRHNRWILCPSKSFPGKFYYFNVQTGEAAWSLNKYEEAMMPKGVYMHRADKWHSYPEPESPPVNDWRFKRMQSFQPRNQVSPMFGRPTFSKYNPNVEQAFFSKYNPYVEHPTYPKYSPSFEDPRFIKSNPNVENSSRAWTGGMMWSPTAQSTPTYMPLSTPSHMPLSNPSHMARMSTGQMTPISTMGTSMYMYPYSDMPNLNSQFWPQQPTYPYQPKSSPWMDMDQKEDIQSLYPNSFDNSKNWMDFVGQRPTGNLFTPNIMNQKPVEPSAKFDMYQQQIDKSNQRLLGQQMENPFQNDINRFTPTAPKQQPQDIFKPKRSFRFEPNSTLVEEPMIKRPKTPFDGMLPENQELFMSKPSGNLHTMRDTGMLNPQKKGQHYSKTQFLTPKKGGQSQSFRRPLCKSTENLVLDREASNSDTSNLNSQTKIFSPPKTPQALLRNPFLTSESSENLSTLNNHGLSPPLPVKRNKPPTRTLPIIKKNGGKMIRSKSFDNLYIRDEETSQDTSQDTLLYYNTTALNQKQKQSNIIKHLSNRSDMNKSKDTNVLNYNDLRLKLVAKKKTKMSDDPCDSSKEKKMKMSYTNEDKEECSKKRVTFDIDDGEKDAAQASGQMEVSDNDQPNLSLSSLRVMGSVPAGDKWYIVVEIGVLLDEYDFLLDFVKEDPSCVVVIPFVARHHFEVLSRGGQGGRPLVMAARRLARRLATPPPNVIFEPIGDQTVAELSLSRSTIKCCQKILQGGDHVILLTNDAELYQMASAADIFAIMLQEIKDSAVNNKPEFRSDQSESKDEETLNDSDEMVADSPFVKYTEQFPGACFRRRLFGVSRNVGSDQTIQNNSMNKQTVMQKNTVKSILEGQKFPPKNRDPEESNDLDQASQVRRQIGRLSTKEIPKMSEAQNNSSRKNILVEEKTEEASDGKEVPFENQTVQQKKNVRIAKFPMTNSVRWIKRVNAYNVEAQLKSFRIKDEIMAENIAKRFDEWICYFTQVMEDALTETLQDGYGRFDPTSPVQPPLNLPETIEHVAEAFSGENAAIGILTTKLSELLKPRNGNPKQAVSPEDFIKILGCGILLIKCLNNDMYPELHLAEESLLDLLRAIENPAGTDDWLPKVTVDRNYECDDASDVDYQERRNFSKKHVEVINYLKEHFPQWCHYTGNPQDYCQEMPNNVLRTLGRDVNLVTIDSTKSITIKTPTETKKNTPENDTKGNIKDPEAKNDTRKKTEVPAKKHESVPNTFGKNRDPVMSEINIEQRERVNQEMEEMIIDMIGLNSITKYYNLNSIIVNKDTNAVPCQEIKVASQSIDNEPKIIQRVDVDTIATNKSNAKENLVLDLDPEHGCSFGETKIGGPKIMRNIKLIDDFEKKMAKSNGNEKKTTTVNENEIQKKENVDKNKDTIDTTKSQTEKQSTKTSSFIFNLDALDYSMELDFEYDSSMFDVVDDDNETIAEDYCIKDENKPNDDVDKSENSENDLQNDDSNDDSGAEVNVVEGKNGENRSQCNGRNREGFDKFPAYTSLKIFFTEISDCLVKSFEFVEARLSECSNFVSEDERKIMNEKVNKLQGYFESLIEKLECIVNRESDEESSVYSAVESDPEAANDAVPSSHRHVIEKYLAQTKLIMVRLRLLVTLTEGDVDVAFLTQHMPMRKKKTLKSLLENELKTCGYFDFSEI